MPRSRRQKKPSPVEELIAVCDEILAVGKGHDNPKTLRMCPYRMWEPTGEKLDELARRASQLVRGLDANYQTERFYWQVLPRPLRELYPKLADNPEREFREACEHVRRLNPGMAEAEVERIAAPARAFAERSIELLTKPQWPGAIDNLGGVLWFFRNPQLLECFEDRFEELKTWARQFAETAVADTPGGRKRTGRETPGDLIASAVAVRDYRVSRTTLRRLVAEGKITDYRQPGHKKNATLILSRAEVASKYPSSKK